MPPNDGDFCGVLHEQLVSGTVNVKNDEWTNLNAL